MFNMVHFIWKHSKQNSNKKHSALFPFILLIETFEEQNRLCPEKAYSY